MPVNAAQLAAGANRTLQSYSEGAPVDQFTSDRPTTDWLIRNREDSVFGNGIYNEKVRYTNDSNYQNYTRDQQVTFNEKETHTVASFQHYEAHDGFTLNETDLANNGIIMTDDRDAVMTGAEKVQLVNMLKEDYTTLKDGFQENYDLELHRDGTASALAIPGLDAAVSTTPASVTFGGIDGSVSGNAYWKNNVSLAISTASAGNLLAKMEIEWRKCITKGKLGKPDFIPAGSSFIDAYAADVRAQPGTSFMVTSPAKGGFTLDGSRTGLFFKGVEIVWDPSFDTLQTLDSASVSWAKRCYFLNSKAIKLRGVKGRWMLTRKPPRLADRYAYYFALTNDSGLTVKQRNAMSVMAIA